MKRSFNYTGRKKIANADVLIVLQEQNEQPTFDASLRFADYTFDGEARVFLEAYRRMEWMRFDYGTVAQPTPPQDRRLIRFETLDGVLFRVRVVAADGTADGRLVGEADQVSPKRPDRREGQRRTLLPVEPRSLEGELYRLDLNGEQPVLLVERELGGDWQSTAGSPLFESLVYPQVLRGIVSELLNDGWPDEDDEDNSWHVDWARLIEQLPGFVEPPDAEEEYNDWVDAIVEAFCREHKMLDRFNTSWTGGAQ